MMADTPPVWKGSSNLFRNLRERGKVTHINPQRLTEFLLYAFIFPLAPVPSALLVNLV